jgi:hypothetical protein
MSPVTNIELVLKAARHLIKHPYSKKARIILDQNTGRGICPYSSQDCYLCPLRDPYGYIISDYLLCSLEAWRDIKRNKKVGEYVLYLIQFVSFVETYKSKGGLDDH